MSKAALLPFSGLVADPLDLPVPNTVECERDKPSASAAARASAARRFTSSMTSSAADLATSVESGAGAAVASELVELVEAKRAPGMEKVNTEAVAEAGAAGGGEPKTKVGGDEASAGGSGSSPASDVASCTVDRDDTMRMP